MKFRKLFAFVGVMVLCFFVFSSYAGIQKAMSVYVKEGRYPEDILRDAIDSSSIGSQFKFRPVYVHLVNSATSGDTTFNPVLSVPAGMTVKVNTMKITCHVEPNVAGTKTLKGIPFIYDLSAATMYKLGTPFSLDADSSYLVAHVMTSVTLDSLAAVSSDSSFAAGDIVFFAVVADSANVDVEDVMLELDVDYDE